MVQDGNTKDFKLEDIKLKFLVYGPPGSGKTFFGATMPSPFFMYHQLTEDGLLYFKMRGVDIPWASFETFNDVHSIIDSIERGQRAQGCESIVLDGWDRLDQPLISQILAENGNAKKMTQPMWGVARDRLRNLANRFLSLGKYYHIAILTGDMMEKNDLSGNILGLPNTVGRFRQEIGGLFDFYLYAVQSVDWINGKQEKNFKLHTIRYQEYGAKDRTGVLDFQEDNNFPALFDKFMEKAKQIRKAFEDGEMSYELLQEIPPPLRRMVGLPEVDPALPTGDGVVQINK